MARRTSRLSPIDSVKHITSQDIGTTLTGNVRNIIVADVVSRGATRSFSYSMYEGAKIFTCYLELWLNGLGVDTNTKFQVVVMKLSNGQTGPTFAQMNNLTAYEGKKNILYTSQGVLGALGAQSIPILRDWYSIPKGKQRFSLGDSINVFVSATGESIQSCGLSIFKEYL